MLLGHSKTFSSEQVLLSLSQMLVTWKGVEMAGGVLNITEMGVGPEDQKVPYMLCLGGAKQDWPKFATELRQLEKFPLV